MLKYRVLFIWVISILLSVTCVFIWAQNDKKPVDSNKPDNQPVTPTSLTQTNPTTEKKDILTLDQGEIVYLKEKKIEIPSIIANPNMPLELFACAEGGKDYESLVVLKCKPQNIQLALILFGLKEGKGPKSFGDATKPTGDLVLIYIEWQDKDKNTHSYQAEDLIIDIRTNEPWPRVGWSFTGSSFEDEIDFDTGKPTGRKIYMANATKTIIATYHDPSAILDNPTESGGVGNIYLPNKKLLPESGTPAKLIIRVPDDKELKELKKTNEKVVKWEIEWKKKIEEQDKKEKSEQEKKK